MPIQELFKKSIFSPNTAVKSAVKMLIANSAALIKAASPQGACLPCLLVWSAPWAGYDPVPNLVTSLASPQPAIGYIFNVLSQSIFLMEQAEPLFKAGGFGNVITWLSNCEASEAAN